MRWSIPCIAITNLRKGIDFPLAHTMGLIAWAYVLLGVQLLGVLTNIPLLKSLG